MVQNKLRPKSNYWSQLQYTHWQKSPSKNTHTTIQVIFVTFQVLLTHLDTGLPVQPRHNMVYNEQPARLNIPVTRLLVYTP